jgi:hypothetical protein
MKTTRPAFQVVTLLCVFGLAIMFAVSAAAQTKCENGICTCQGGGVPQGNGQALRIVGACTVTASTTPYKFADVNIYTTGASLTFIDPGDDSKTDFWASSILVESGASLNAGTPSAPYGANKAVLTIHLWGADQGYSGLGGAGIVCLTDNHCGVPDDIWNSNGSGKVNLPGGVTDYFYQYMPLKYDEKDPLGYFGYKVLAVSYNGTLALYGAKGSVQDPQSESYSGTSWVRLDANAPKGSAQLTLERLVDWQQGDELVVASTDYMADHSEKVDVLEVNTDSSGTRSVVTLQKPLSYPHHGQMYDLSNVPDGIGPDPDLQNVSNPGKAADVRAAVGLLSRSIVIKSGGDEIGKELDSDSFFGAHTVFRQGFLSLHIQGVEFSLMGQGGRIMHYPVHFHMARKTPPDTVVEDCSVNESMTRWYVIHGSEGITLARNVGYKSIGHGYYLEDGTETDNKLYANLGIFARAAVDDGNNTRQVPGILAAPYPAWNDPSDSQEHVPFHTDIDHPADFWIMNGWNDFKYNMAVGAGSCGACYWLVTGANSTMSRSEKWEGYSAEQSSLARAGMTPLKSFVGNSCSGAANAFNTISDSAVCHGVVNENPAAELPRMPPIENKFGIPGIKSPGALDYYPTVDRGGGRFATQCPSNVDCGDNNLVPRCSSLDPNCMVTVLDHFTTSFNYSETNFAAIWLRPQWYLFLNSLVTDVQNGGVTFVTGGGYTDSDLIKGHWALARKSAFIGTVQNPKTDPAENNFASITGPFNPDTQLACARKTNGAPSGLFCLDQPSGMLMSLSNFGMNQRFFSIYDGPSYQDSNAYLNIATHPITDCDLANHNCSNSKYMYGQVLGLPTLKGTDTCYMPNAAIAWKQPNGFYYPPAFHSDNLYFGDDVEIRHYVIEPLFRPNPDYLFQTDLEEVNKKYCTANPTMFDSFTDIDRQTELNDDNGSLTGLVNTISVNEDHFFDAPVEDHECRSDIPGAEPPGTAKTSPYDYVTTVLYSDHGTGVPGVWDRSCSTGTCFGVPLHRLFLTQNEIDNKASPPPIMMMGQDVGQRSTLSVNHGNFYIDTTQDLAQQRALRASQVSVFEPGHTYYNFLLFAKPATRQTYSVWVGPGFDPDTDIKAYKVDISGTPPAYTDVSWPSSWPKPVYVSSTGMLTVTMDMNFSEFENGYAAAKAEECQPATFCSLNSVTNTCGCALNQSDGLYHECESVCGKWAGHDVDCPLLMGSDNKMHSACFGFGFKLPRDFANGTPHTPGGMCYPNDPDWHVDFVPADETVAGACHYASVPPYVPCTQGKR